MSAWEAYEGAVRNAEFCLTRAAAELDAGRNWTGEAQVYATLALAHATAAAVRPAE